MILKRKKKINIDKIDSSIKRHNRYKNFCLFMIGMTFSAISISVFYNPNQIVTTGSTGLSIIINSFLNIDLSLIVFAVSSILLVLGFGLFGIEYGSKNILGTILFPIFIKASTLINNYVSFENTSLFLLILIGSVFAGIGFGLIKKSGYSQGGFFVLYDFINNKFKISVGNSSLFINGFIILGSMFIFGLDKCIYSLVGLYVTTTIADRIMLGISRNKAFYIITKKPNEVKEYIIDNLHHTVTIVNSRGGYTDKKKKMLLCVIPTIEYSLVKDVIKEIDEHAFFLITDSYFVSK